MLITAQIHVLSYFLFSLGVSGFLYVGVDLLLFHAIYIRVPIPQIIMLLDYNVKNPAVANASLVARCNGFEQVLFHD